MATLTMPTPSSMEKPLTRTPSDLQTLTTEKPNEASAGLDTKSALEIARIINQEDTKVAAAVKKALPEVAMVIDMVARSLRDGGRLIYVGAALAVIHYMWLVKSGVRTPWKDGGVLIVLLGVRIVFAIQKRRRKVSPPRTAEAAF